MAGLSIPSLSASNSTRCTLSAWVRFPASPASVGFWNGLAQWGSNPGNTAQSFIRFTRESGANRLSFRLNSSEADLNGSGGAVSGTCQTTVAYDAWHHILFAADLTPPSLRVPLGTGTQNWARVDGLTEQPEWPSVPTYVVDSNPDNTVPETDPDHSPPYWSGMLWVQDSFTPGSPPLGYYWVYSPATVTFNNFGALLSGKVVRCYIDGVEVWFQNKPPKANRYEFEGTPICGTWPGSDPNGRDPVPSLPLKNNGYEYGLPVRGDNLGVSVLTEYGICFFWAGVYADPSVASNFLKFVNISGNIGTPASPTLAINEFGTPTVHYRGKASDNTFYTNRGSGGAAVKTGTITDFTPTPSYG